MYELKENPYPMQPRERLEFLGEECLSDVELLAILLRTGTKKYSSLNLALEILQHFETLDNLRKASINELREISGIGLAKSIEIRAMIEFRIIEKKTIFIGAVNQATASPREILYHAIKNLSVGLLVAHNHPSGNLKPSQADKIFTTKIKKSCEDVGINFIDHIIVGAGNYFSFREEEIRK